MVVVSCVIEDASNLIVRSLSFVRVFAIKKLTVFFLQRLNGIPYFEEGRLGVCYAEAWYLSDEGALDVELPVDSSDELCVRLALVQDDGVNE